MHSPVDLGRRPALGTLLANTQHLVGSSGSPTKAASASPTKAASPSPTKAALPREFLKIKIDASSPSDVVDAASSPETVTTSISVHGKTPHAACTMVAIVLTEIFFLREVFPRAIFREASRFGQAVHRLGSPQALADDALGARLAEAFAQLARAEELLASGPSGLLVELSSSEAEEPVERWDFTIEVDDNEGEEKSEGEGEMRSELAILLKQVGRSVMFLPPLEPGPLHLELHAVHDPARFKAAPALMQPRLIGFEEADEAMEEDEEDEDCDDEDEDEDEAMIPCASTPPFASPTSVMHASDAHTRTRTSQCCATAPSSTSVSSAMVGTVELRAVGIAVAGLAMAYAAAAYQGIL